MEDALDQPTVVTVAHGYGNRRARIERALAAGVDLIEADLRSWRGRVAIRHEHRLSGLPLLYNAGLRGIHKEGPFAISVGPHFFRLDLRPIAFPELLARVADKSGLFLDLKAAAYSEAEARAFVGAVLGDLEAARFSGTVDFTGSWRLIDMVREQRPAILAHYSVDSASHWEALRRRLVAGSPPPGVTIHRDLLDEERGRLLRDAGVDFYCWDVRNRADAERALACGASGVLADDLDLLRTIAGRPVQPPRRP